MAGLGSLAPRAALAEAPWEIQWEDLIPPGVPYSEIIGEGEIDAINDTWNPIFDENATKLNPALNDAYVRLPGFIVPLELEKDGVREFVLAPYQGACIHTPPPPPNQLVFVQALTPWPSDNMWDAIWVVGRMKNNLTQTDIAQTGYAMIAEHIELYQW